MKAKFLKLGGHFELYVCNWRLVYVVRCLRPFNVQINADLVGKDSCVAKSDPIDNRLLANITLLIRLRSILAVFFYLTKNLFYWYMSGKD